MGKANITSLEDIPELFECVHLEELNFSNEWFEYEGGNSRWKRTKNTKKPNKFTYFPPQFAQLKQLKKIRCEYVGLTDADILGEMPQLTHLMLDKNELQSIAFLQNLPAFTRLDFFVVERLSGARRFHVERFGSSQRNTFVVVMFDSFAYHNAIRHHLIAQIRALKAHNRLPYAGEVLIRWDLLQAFLYEVESYPYQDFHPENADLDALAFLMEVLPANFPTLVKPFQQICKELKMVLKKNTSLPTVPHRKALTKTEWETVWVNFDAKLKHRKGGKFIDELEASFMYIQDFMAQEVESMYCVSFLNHQYNYELSGKWFAEMYDGSCMYWIDANFEWAFLGDGHGYPKYFGDELERFI